MMNKLSKAYQTVSNCFEIYLPCVSFTVLFVTYVIMIIYRYLFNAQINEIYELSMIVFVWTVILSASYCSKIDEHIMFTILYDKLPENGKCIMRILGNAAIITIFMIVLPCSVDSISFLAIKKSSLMKIPFNIIYAPFLVFMVLTILHHLVHFVRDLVFLVSNRKGGKT